MDIRTIAFCLTCLLSLGISGCGEETQDEVRAAKRSGEEHRNQRAERAALVQASMDLQGLFDRQTSIEEGWLKILEAHTAEPEVGIEKGAEFAEKYAAESKQLAKRVIAIKNESPAGEAGFISAMRDHTVRIGETTRSVDALMKKYGDRKSDVASQHRSLGGAFNDLLATELYIDKRYLN